MNSEVPGSPEHRRAEVEHRLDVEHATIREKAKDLREILHRASPGLANRERVLQLVEELLALVPARDQEFEEIDEHERALKRGERRPFADDPEWVGRLPDDPKAT
jgi:hypothetical protein